MGALPPPRREGPAYAPLRRGRGKRTGQRPGFRRKKQAFLPSPLSDDVRSGGHGESRRGGAGQRPGGPVDARPRGEGGGTEHRGPGVAGGTTPAQARGPHPPRLTAKGKRRPRPQTYPLRRKVLRRPAAPHPRPPATPSGAGAESQPEGRGPQ